MSTIEQQAAAKGTQAGKAAASWVFDGNTTTETYRQFLVMHEDGDPMIENFGPGAGWLSGEWADSETPASLMDDLRIGNTIDHDAVCEAYETAADEAYWAELERVARLQVGE